MVHSFIINFITEKKPALLNQANYRVNFSERVVVPTHDSNFYLEGKQHL